MACGTWCMYWYAVLAGGVFYEREEGMKYSIYEPIEITAYLENEIMSASPKKRMQYIFEIDKQQQVIIDRVLPNPKFTPEGEEKP